MEILIRPLCADDVPAAAAIEAAVSDGWSENGIRGALASDAARCFFESSAIGRNQAVANRLHLNFVKNSALIRNFLLHLA